MRESRFVRGQTTNRQLKLRPKFIGPIQAAIPYPRKNQARRKALKRVQCGKSADRNQHNVLILRPKLPPTSRALGLRFLCAQKSTTRPRLSRLHIGFGESHTLLPFGSRTRLACVRPLRKQSSSAWKLFTTRQTTCPNSRRCARHSIPCMLGSRTKALDRRG